MHTVSAFALLHTPYLPSGRSMVVGHVPMVQTCSFMCSSLEHCHHLDIKAIFQGMARFEPGIAIQYLSHFKGLAMLGRKKNPTLQSLWHGFSLFIALKLTSTQTPPNKTRAVQLASKSVESVRSYTHLI